MTFSLSKRFTVDDVELAWGRWGPESGTPLVLAHGFTGSAADFGQVVDDLAADRPVIALDHRGHGESTNIGDESGYTLDRLAADLAAWIAKAANEPVDLLGHSMGGRLVLQVALDHPELLRSLILMDTSATRFSASGAADDVVHAFLSDFDPARGLPAFVYEGIGPEQELIEATVDAEFLLERAARSAQCDPFAFKTLGRQLISSELPSLMGRLGELAMPVTVVVGSRDEPLVGFAPDIAAGITDAELAVIDGAYHSPQLTHRDPWLATIREHLDRAATTR